MKQYRILEARTVTDLEDMVEKYLAKDWDLQGGVNTAIFPKGSIREGEIVYYQAVTR